MVAKMGQDTKQSTPSKPLQEGNGVVDPEGNRFSRARPAVAVNSILVMRGRRRNELGYMRLSSSGSASRSSGSSKVSIRYLGTTICTTYRGRELQDPRYPLLLRIPGRGGPGPVDQGMLNDAALIAVTKTNPTNEHVQVQVSGGHDQASGKNTLEHSVRSPMGRREKTGVFTRA